MSDRARRRFIVPGLLWGLPVARLAMRSLPACAAESAPFAMISRDSAGRLGARPAQSPMAAYAIRGGMRALERTPHPMSLVHTQGTLPHQGIYDESLEAGRSRAEISFTVATMRLMPKAGYRHPHTVRRPGFRR
jgi:hypothetical protein